MAPQTPHADHGQPEADELSILRADAEMADLFIAEALDHLGTIEAALLALDTRPDDRDLLNDIFRPFHTVKGNAGALGLSSLESVAHAVESLLDLARSGRHRMGPHEVDVVLRAVDVLTTMVQSIRGQLAGEPAIDTAAARSTLLAQVHHLMTTGGESVTVDIASTPATIDETTTEVSVATATPARRWDDASGQTAIKVDTRKLDTLVDAVGELIIVQSLVQEDPALRQFADSSLGRNLAQLKRITAELQRNAMALRMVPIRQAFQKIARVVRDLSRKAGKPVELVLGGEDTELDRKVVEEITDPLVHMVRNSIDHGLESPETRAARGKPAQGRVTLNAFHQGGHIVVEVGDDGAGLNTDVIRRKAIERGVIAADATLTPDEIHMLIFEPGFSTAETITEISGRGVGMDVVRRNIEGLQGRVEIRTEAGKGTTVVIKLPLTLAVLDGLVVRVGSQRFVLPAAAVRESLRPKREQIHAVAGRPRIVQVRETLLPLMPLGEFFKLDGEQDPTRAAVVVIEDDGTRIGLVVDDLLGQQEVVIKSLGDLIKGVRGVAGGAILGDGRIGLILDPHGLVGLMRADTRAA